MIITEPDWNGKISNPDGKVTIGDGTIIRELTIINKPVESETYIGNNCYIMNRCFVAHDCHIGDEVQLNPGCSIAGFVKIGDRTQIGMNASVHQFSNIGRFCMIGAGSFFKGDSPDGITWGGVPARPIKVNEIGINKANIPDSEKSRILNRGREFVSNYTPGRHH